MRKVVGLLFSVIIISMLAQPSVFAEVPPLPPPPQPSYEWHDSGSTLYYATYQGVNYSLGVVVGLYAPVSIELNKNFTIYFYVTRAMEVVTFPLGVPFMISICIGLGKTLPIGEIYVHVGVGVFNVWDMWSWHPPTPIPPCFSPSLSVSYPKISYASVSDIPYGRWDGPYTACAAIASGYVVPEFQPSTTIALLTVILVMVTILLRKRFTEYRQISKKPAGFMA